MCKTKGFTLVELMITIAIIAILASIAIPAYVQYTNKARYSEVIEGAAAYKAAVATCAMSLGDLDGCSAGRNGIAVPRPTNNVQSIKIKDGVITAQGKGTSPLNATYILSPTLSNAGINWQVSGSCLVYGLC